MSAGSEFGRYFNENLQLKKFLKIEWGFEPPSNPPCGYVVHRKRAHFELCLLSTHFWPSS